MKRLILAVLFLSVISSVAFSEVTRKTTKQDSKGAASEITYYDGDKELAKETFDAAGNIRKTGVIPDGMIKEYFNGILWAAGTYKNNKRNGVMKWLDASGKVRTEENYKDDVLSGSYKIYYESGKLQQELFYNDGKKNGPTKLYYESGKIRTDGNYKNGKLDGVSKSYDEKGKVTKEWVYKDGKVIK
jgi:antitoxin component YwqK of YwqJK toxin-antitoxin module